ncbi:MAG: DNA polymerase III subunit psi [Ekhidna sp.]|nr:DNA polymerase III subunit psi [Ekhidna sp.]
MMNKTHLHLLINEEIYRINREQNGGIPPKDAIVEHKTEDAQISSKEQQNGHLEEVAEIRNKKPEEHVIPLAIFHDSSSEPDLQLLQKIIDACKLEKETYTIFGSGFNKELKFDKALVFVAKSKTFYEPIPYREGQILCSKPLGQISNDQQEKAKLWGALQKFI